MLSLFIKSALRSLARHKMYTIINILGLMIGVLVFSLIMLYVSHENSFDDFHVKRDNIYRITSSNKERAGAITPYVWGQYLRNDFPEIENYTTFQIMSLTTKMDDIVLTEDKILMADSTFFEIFDFPVISGNKSEFLKSPNKIIMTRQTADRYFVEDNPIGKSIEINHYGTFVSYEVSGIVECPKNSHIQFDFILPIHNDKRLSPNAWAYEHWRAHFVNTYLLLSKGSDIQNLEGKFEKFLFDHAGEEVSSTYTIGLQALKDIYQNSEYTFDFQPRGDSQNSKILSVVAFGILFMALVNFINITTAQSLRRAKEVGLKKVLGVKRSSLLVQFVGESMIVSVIAVLLSCAIIIFILPKFNDFTGKQFTMEELLTLRNMSFMFGLLVFVGIVSGLYPALLLSSYKTASILSSRSAARSKGAVVRKILVITQFTLTVVLLVSTGVIYNQVRYMNNKDLGFDSEQILVINDGGEVSTSPTKVQLLREQIIQNNNVHSITASTNYPGKQIWAMRYLIEGSNDDQGTSISTIFTDHDFLDTYGIDIVKGRNWDRSVYSDSSSFLINQSAVDYFSNTDASWKDNPLQKELTLMGYNIKGKVIGVFKDFHYESLKTTINPLVLNIFPQNFNSLQMRISTNNVEQAIDEIRNTWKKLFPEVPFGYSFVDNEFETYLKSDRQLGNLLQVFTILSLMVAILGLFGLASFLAFEKAKEMSIRKVIGATEKQLMFQLSWLFLKLVLVANFIAIPLGYWLMYGWMEGFAYRADMPHGLFLLAVGTTLVVSLLTVAYHAIRTAMSNPVDILAQE